MPFRLECTPKWKYDHSISFLGYGQFRGGLREGYGEIGSEPIKTYRHFFCLIFRASATTATYATLE
jgi:hypothetical protein